MHSTFFGQKPKGKLSNHRSFLNFMINRNFTATPFLSVIQIWHFTFDAENGEKKLSTLMDQYIFICHCLCGPVQLGSFIQFLSSFWFLLRFSSQIVRVCECYVLLLVFCSFMLHAFFHLLLLIYIYIYVRLYARTHKHTRLLMSNTMHACFLHRCRRCCLLSLLFFIASCNVNKIWSGP